MQPAVEPEDEPGQHRQADTQQDICSGTRQVMEHVDTGVGYATRALASWSGA
ncbi:MAG: hypothetical protein WCP99_02265 [Burkholderiales bacterium]